MSTSGRDRIDIWDDGEVCYHHKSTSREGRITKE